MASMELPPRRSKRNNEITIQRNRSALEVLMQMGFPQHRAEKALAATGDKGVQLASDWLLSHVNDPNLDDCTARDYILYLCPVGQLQHELLDFWQKSYQECGWNRAHNYFPHITLCSFFKAEDAMVSKLSHAIKTVAQHITHLPEKIELEYFSSANFIGLFVTENSAPMLKQITADFAEEVRKSVGVTVEPHKKQLHMSLAYQFPPEHRERLESVAKNININLPVRWDLRMYSRDPKTSNCQVRKVLYTHTPSVPDEMDLIDGDFIFLEESEIENSPDGWYQGMSWLTGCGGMFAGNFTERTGETETWTMHRSIPIVGTDLTLLGSRADSPTYMHVQDEYEQSLPHRGTLGREHLYTRLQHQQQHQMCTAPHTTGDSVTHTVPPVPRMRRSTSGASSTMPPSSSSSTGGGGSSSPTPCLPPVTSAAGSGAASPSSSSSAASSPGSSKTSRQITRVPSDLSMSDSPKVDRKGPAPPSATSGDPQPQQTRPRSSIGGSGIVIGGGSASGMGQGSGVSTGSHVPQQGRTGSGQISNYVNVTPTPPRTGAHCSQISPAHNSPHFTDQAPANENTSNKTPTTMPSNLDGIMSSPKMARRTGKEPSGSSTQMRPARHSGPRQLYVVRHGERIDFTFGKDWIQNSFDQSGNYIRYDLNMPKLLPRRKGGPQDFSKDSPLTVQGHFQAQLVGEAMKEKDIPIAHVYSSPSLRCVETAASILKGLGMDREVHVEPGLFEWLGWYQSGLPKFMSCQEMRDWGYNVTLNYVPVWPPSKYNMQETTEQYYDRCYQATKDILRRHENEGGTVLLVAHKGSVDVCTRLLRGKPPLPRRYFRQAVNNVPYCGVAKCDEVTPSQWILSDPGFPCFSHKGGNVILVAHAASLDVCTRQLVGQPPRSHAGFHDVLHKIPYCALSVAQEACLVRDTWYLIEPPILPFAHTNNPKYNWTCLTTPSMV